MCNVCAENLKGEGKTPQTDLDKEKKYAQQLAINEALARMDNIPNYDSPISDNPLEGVPGHSENLLRDSGEKSPNIIALEEMDEVAKRGKKEPYGAKLHPRSPYKKINI